nr:GGDEF domain-containing protein [Natronocella acetinitrilica]
MTSALDNDSGAPGSIAPLPGDVEVAGAPSWRLATALMATIEVEELLHRFFHLLREQSPCDAFAYRHDPIGLRVRFGIVGRSHAEYHLKLGDQSLGYIGFSRRRRFVESDLELIERALGILLHPLRNALRFRDVRESARRDPLTGVFNRTAMDELLARQLAHSCREGGAVSLLILDIDNFKQINDRFGHGVGDDVLIALAEVLQSVCRGSDPVFRYAGDEFVVIMPEAEEAGVRCLAERLREAVQTHNFGLPGDALVEVSLGIASCRPGDTPESLLQRADRGLYRAKGAGRNRVEGE